MTKREFLDTVFALVPNEANKIMDAFDEYVESNVVPTGRSGKERRMTKYIIELEDDIKYIVINGRADNRCYTLVRPVAELEELNSDYINEHFGELQDTAYKKGLHDGESKCRYCNDYQRGLEDAWEAARKIIRMPDGDILDLFPDCYASVCTAVQAILKYDASEAIAKLKAYEDKHSDRIEVGDEVISDTGTKFIVTAFTTSDSVCGFSERGLGCFNTIDKLAKTGKRFDIQSILEAMRK